MLILFGTLFFLSEILEKEYDLKGIKKGYVLAIPLIMLCIASYFTGRNIKGNLDKMKKMMLVCLIALSVSVGMVGIWADRLWVLLTITSLVGIAIGAMLPVLDALITENIDKEERGTVSSFYSSARFIGVAAGPPIMALVMNNYLNVSYLMAGALGVILTFLVFKFIDVKEIEN